MNVVAAVIKEEEEVVGVVYGSWLEVVVVGSDSLSLSLSHSLCMLLQEGQGRGDITEEKLTNKLKKTPCGLVDGCNVQSILIGGCRHAFGVCEPCS